LQDIEDVLDLALDFLVKLNRLISVDGVERIPHQFINVFGFADVQFLQNIFVVKNALDYIELLPLYQNLAVG
jgi:hypothetical protein